MLLADEDRLFRTSLAVVLGAQTCPLQHGHLGLKYVIYSVFGVRPRQSGEAILEFIKNEVRSFLGEDSEDRGKPSNALVDTMQSRRFK